MIKYEQLMMTMCQTKHYLSGMMIASYEGREKIENVYKGGRIYTSTHLTKGYYLELDTSITTDKDLLNALYDAHGSIVDAIIIKYEGSTISLIRLGKE